ncbi:MAG: hypothetical protein IT480_03820 [Gammaproteobacteria bacterium]|nr:hypothetical protein [Gammaproteobacteria bacterium]
MDVDACSPSGARRAPRACAAARRCLRVRQRRMLAQYLPAATEGIGAALGAGADLPAAVRAMALGAPGSLPATALAPLLGIRAGGSGLEQAFLALRDGLGGTDLTLLAHAVIIAGRVPQAQPRVFLHLAQHLRARRRLEQRLAALRARARRLGLAAGVLPPAALAGALGLDPLTARLLLQHPAGWLLPGLLASLLLGGLVLLRRTAGPGEPEH